MKRLPRLQICVLDQVLSLMPVTQKRRGGTVEIRQVRQGRSLEAFDLNVWTKKQNPAPTNVFRRMEGSGGLEWQSRRRTTCCGVRSIRRAATPHTITGPKLP